MKDGNKMGGDRKNGTRTEVRVTLAGRITDSNGPGEGRATDSGKGRPWKD